MVGSVGRGLMCRHKLVYRPRPNLEEESSYKPLFYDLDCFLGVVGRLPPPRP
jgi:hypothetical protein